MIEAGLAPKGPVQIDVEARGRPAGKYPALEPGQGSIQPISEHGPVDLGQDAPDPGVIQAQDVHPVKGHGIAKTDEALVYGFQAGVKIQMIGVHVGDHGHHWGKAQKGAVGLVGLGDQVLALAQFGPGPDGV